LNKINNLNYYFITYDNFSRNGNYFDVEQALKAGCYIVQYREKNKTLNEMICEAKKIKNLCSNNVVFLINDFVDLAIAVNADGVHIGQDDASVSDARKILGDDRIIGLTVHDEKEAVEAEKLGVDYISLAPIFATNTKGDSGFPCGLEMLKNVCDCVNIPIVAVGGITKDNVADVIRAGADGVVAVSSVLNSVNVYDSIMSFIKIIKEVKN
jgi:thiamine-phosphate pyrophosphorylase